MSSFGGEHGESQDVKLTEEERKLVAKLLSDPTYFPVEFRTWLKNYIEGAGISVSISQVKGGSGSIVQLPAGIILPYAGTVIATNVLVCDGTQVARTLYPALFEAIGTTWGPGDGTTTFNLPDLRDRALYGIGGRVGMGETDGRGLGSRGGPDHYHELAGGTDSGGSHSHGVGGNTDDSGPHDHNILWGVGSGGTGALGGGGSLRYLVDFFDQNTDDGGNHSHGISGWTDEQGEHDHGLTGTTTGGYDLDRPSYAGVNYVITTGKGG